MGACVVASTYSANSRQSCTGARCRADSTVFSSGVVCFRGQNCVRWSMWLPAPAPTRIVSQIILTPLSSFRQSRLTKEACSEGSLYELPRRSRLPHIQSFWHGSTSSTTRNQLQTTIMLNGGDPLAFTAVGRALAPSCQSWKRARAAVNVDVDMFCKGCTRRPG